jgi:hypothetical protein
MLSGRPLRVALPVIVAWGLLPCAAPLHAQDAPAQQADSVADAARRAREEKKRAAKPAKVVTDDDLPTKTPAQAAVDNANAAAAAKSDAQAPTAPPPAAPDAASDQGAAAATKAPATKDGADPEIAKLKAQVAQAKKELDLLQREFALDNDAYYTKANFSDDKAGKAKLDDEQEHIRDKKQQVDELSAQLAAAQEQQDRRKKDQASSPQH